MDYELDLRKRMYKIAEEAGQIVQIGSSLSENTAPNELEAKAFLSSYKLAIEARALFRLYHSLFSGDNQTQKHERILDELIEMENKRFLKGIIRKSCL